MDIALNTVVGWCDGYQRGYIRGWAWYPRQPHETVTIQLLVDGVLMAEAAACVSRPDLKSAGIGHGRHAFAIAFSVPPDAPDALSVTVRAKDGPVLNSGQFDIRITPEEQVLQARRRSQAHLETIFGPLASDTPRPPAPAPTGPKLNFVLYCATGTGDIASKLGAADYSYAFVMRGFRAVLRQMGVVHVVREPAGEVDAIHRACLSRGEDCVFLSFAPPHSTTLGLACPTIPVIAWEFGTIPTQVWDDEPRHDWRHVLRECGRAIAISGFAARVIGRTMGAQFPVIGIPTPVWDRLAGLRARIAAVPPPGSASLVFDGFVWDSRVDSFWLGMNLPPIPAMPARAAEAGRTLRDWRMRLDMATAQARAEAAQRGAEVDMLREAARAEAARRRATEEFEDAGRRLAAAHAQALAEARAETEAAHLARAAVEARMQADADFQLAAQAAQLEEAALPKTLRHRAGLTRRMALGWYRDVVRDALPAPVAASFSRGGRLAWRARAALAGSVRADVSEPASGRPQEEIEPAAAPSQPGLPAAIEPAAFDTLVEPAPNLEPPAPLELAGPKISVPELEPVQPAHENPPPPRTIIPDGLPLPEPGLAIFDPDPWPQGPPPPAPPRATVALDGIVFTSVLAPKDGRKNWQDILSAFVFAFRDTPEATLVFKMIGGDAAFWWWEFHDIITRLPAFACRVVVLHGYLDDAAYGQLIEATHVVVNASQAEGQCLPLVEFMSAGRPAIAPDHTAMADYITTENAIVVRGDVEYCAWPHNPHNDLVSTRMRMDWSSLCGAFTEAFRIVTTDPARHAAMRKAAAASMQAYCGDAAVLPALREILYLDTRATAPDADMAA